MESENDNLRSTSSWKRDAVEEKLKAHELKITATETALKSLQETRYELHELLNSTTLIMTSLPLDILTEIFSLTCTDLDSPHRDLIYLPVQFVLGRVCRAWRRILWSTPRIWTKICLKFAKNRYETQECLLRDWIARTADCSLDLYFSVAHSLSRCAWEPPIDLFYVLLETSQRWRSFSYPIPSQNFPVALGALQEEEAQFPLLNTLTLFGHAELPDDMDQWWFNSPPQLRNLTVHGLQRFHLNIDWSSLATLSAKFDLIGCISVLNRVSESSLENLSLSIMGRRPFSINDTDIHYILPKLRTLTIEGASALVGSLFCQMTLPLLKELDSNLRDDKAQYPWLESLAEMAVRSNFQLTSLIIKQEWIRKESRLLDLLRTMPSIEHFELDCATFAAFKLTNQTVNQLNPARQPSGGDNPRDFLPNLKAFKFTGHVNFNPDSLLDMVQKRFEAVQSRLRASGDLLPFAEKLRVKIIYSNISWHQEKNPNVWRDFYLAIARMSSQGLTFVLEWEENVDSDLFSDGDEY